MSDDARPRLKFGDLSALKKTKPEKQTRQQAAKQERNFNSRITVAQAKEAYQTCCVCGERLGRTEGYYICTACAEAGAAESEDAIRRGRNVRQFLGDPVHGSARWLTVDDWKGQGT